MKKHFALLLPLMGILIFQPAVAAKLVKPATVSREEWGSKPAPIPDSRKQIPVWITIHHAGEFWKYGADPADFVRRMQVWGQNRPKIEKPPRDTFWPDLAYHFMIAPDGRIFEGRPVEYEPETNTKYSVNGNIGVEMMGDFEKQRPSIEQIRSCVAITAWLSKTYKIDLEHIRTHMDAAPNQTDCPGRDFYRYMKDGQFKKWVQATRKGKTPEIVLGEPLSDGPTKSINDPKAAAPGPAKDGSTPNAAPSGPAKDGGIPNAAPSGPAKDGGIPNAAPPGAANESVPNTAPLSSLTGKSAPPDKTLGSAPVLPPQDSK